MKNLVLIISVLLLSATFTKNASAQLEVLTTNKVRIGENLTQTDNMLSIEAQYSAPGAQTNFMIGDYWDYGKARLQMGVNTTYGWIQSHNFPLLIDPYGQQVLFSSMVDWSLVGIGHVNGYVPWIPSASLEVKGDVKATIFITTSDERLKKDITKFSPNKTKNKSIEAKMYSMDYTNPIFGITDIENEKMAKMDRDFYKRKHFGFLAQDVQKVYPELVYEDNDGYLAIDYQGFIPILFETVKEQQTQIDAQQAIIESQAQLLSNLEKRVLLLEKKN
jgi:hypothetical protein